MPSTFLYLGLSTFYLLMITLTAAMNCMIDILLQCCLVVHVASVLTSGSRVIDAKTNAPLASDWPAVTSFMPDSSLPSYSNSLSDQENDASSVLGVFEEEHSTISSSCYDDTFPNLQGFVEKEAGSSFDPEQSEIAQGELGEDAQSKGEYLSATPPGTFKSTQTTFPITSNDILPKGRVKQMIETYEQKTRSKPSVPQENGHTSTSVPLLKNMAIMLPYQAINFLKNVILKVNPFRFKISKMVLSSGRNPLRSSTGSQDIELSKASNGVPRPQKTIPLPSKDERPVLSILKADIHSSQPTDHFLPQIKQKDSPSGPTVMSQVLTASPQRENDKLNLGAGQMKAQPTLNAKVESSSQVADTNLQDQHILFSSRRTPSKRVEKLHHTPTNDAQTHLSTSEQVDPNRKNSDSAITENGIKSTDYRVNPEEAEIEGRPAPEPSDHVSTQEKGDRPGLTGFANFEGAKNLVHPMLAASEGEESHSPSIFSGAFPFSGTSHVLNEDSGPTSLAQQIPPQPTDRKDIAPSLNKSEDNPRPISKFPPEESKPLDLNLSEPKETPRSMFFLADFNGPHYRERVHFEDTPTGKSGIGTDVVGPPEEPPRPNFPSLPRGSSEALLTPAGSSKPSKPKSILKPPGRGPSKRRGSSRKTRDVNFKFESPDAASSETSSPQGSSNAISDTKGGKSAEEIHSVLPGTGNDVRQSVAEELSSWKKSLLKSKSAYFDNKDVWIIPPQSRLATSLSWRNINVPTDLIDDEEAITPRLNKVTTRLPLMLGRLSRKDAELISSKAFMNKKKLQQDPDYLPRKKVPYYVIKAELINRKLYGHPNKSKKRKPKPRESKKNRDKIPEIKRVRPRVYFIHAFTSRIQKTRPGKLLSFLLQQLALKLHLMYPNTSPFPSSKDDLNPVPLIKND